MRKFSSVFLLMGFCSLAIGQKVGVGIAIPTNTLHVFSGSDPLRIEGLASGAATDSFLTVNSTGVVKRRTIAATIGGTGWALLGNAGTNPATQFLGTTDGQPLNFRTNNLRSGLIDFDTLKRNNSFGYRAMGATITTASGNNAFGFFAMRNLTTGLSNTALGDSAAFNLNTGSDNVAIGSDAGRALQSGVQNVAVGSRTLSGEGAGSNNVGLGYRAMELTLTSENVAVGSLALKSNTNGSNNIAVGSNALGANVSAFNNLAIGNDALSALTTGSENLGIGYHVGITHTTQINNTLIGHYSFASVVPSNAASYNTMVGYQTGGAMAGGSNNVAMGFNAMGQMTGGSSNTFVGYAADVNPVVTTAPSNSMGLGNSVLVTASNQVRVGNSSVTSIGGQVAWTTLSDERVKINVLEDVQGLAFIAKLRPVTYKYDLPTIDNWQRGSVKANAVYNTTNTTTRFSGFLAQEVAQTAKETGYQFSGVDVPESEKGLYGLRYSEFVVPLVKAVQELKTIVEQQQEQIKLLQKRLEEKKP